MRKFPHTSRLLTATVTLVLTTAVISLSNSAYAASPAQVPTPSAEGVSAETSETTAPTVQSPASAAATMSAHLPIISKNWPLSTIFGVETSDLSASANGIFGANPTWIRRNALLWKDAEPTQGARNWTAVAALEQDMIAAAQKNARMIVIIFGAPAWAQDNPGSPCGRIKLGMIGAFAAFVRDAVAKYSKPPYNVKYWEIWNEPDLPTTATSASQPYGCWGNGSDPYYGGGYYASVLGQVAPQIRAADPSAKILLGGLLLGCSPDRDASCTAGKYLEGILRGGGAPHFDGVSFHAYDAFDVGANTIGVYSWNSWGTAWNTTGPVVATKAQFIKKTLAQFGVVGKFLINTEVGLICWDCVTAPSNFEVTKAYYVPQAYGAALAEGLAGNVWYSWEGWFMSQLVAEPGLTAYKLAVQKLGNATYTGAIGVGDVGVGGVKGYKFVNNSGKALWVLWSLDGGAKNITLPATPTAVTDALGAVQAASTSALQVTVKPLYVEFP